ncbi:hypothetical protein EVAR_45845_1 [Eumeta japonica]|uniref:Uncharacterized protein n=1 Tax=Eumeta variegata TaxID=151549 RepID=A0A4C1WKL7_EUMVA|nr:hypothetical protein EVAR_45845_1 [Eumeta japonica]
MDTSEGGRTLRRAGRIRPWTSGTRYGTRRRTRSFLSQCRRSVPKGDNKLVSISCRLQIRIRRVPTARRSALSPGCGFIRAPLRRTVPPTLPLSEVERLRPPRRLGAGRAPLTTSVVDSDSLTCSLSLETISSKMVRELGCYSRVRRLYLKNDHIICSLTKWTGGMARAERSRKLRNRHPQKRSDDASESYSGVEHESLGRRRADAGGMQMGEPARP